jgi:hypothetical protein
MAVKTAAGPGVAAILKILPLLDLAVIGLGALAFATIYWADGGRSSRHTSSLSRREGIILAAGQGILGIVLLISAILLERALVLRLTLRGEGLGPVSLSILLAYLGFSSLALAWKAHRPEPAPLIARVHLLLTAAATGALLLLIPSSPAIVRKNVAFLAAVTIASLILALWHHLRTNPQSVGSPGKETQEGGRTQVGRGEPEPDGSDLPSLFPRALLSRFSDPLVIGSGGVSRVFRARRRDTGGIVAVKVPLSMDEVTGAAFLKEMRTWEGLHHGNIVRILGANILPVPYVEMEFLPRSLDELEKPLDLKTAARIIIGITRGLAFAHARGIVHRDLKPRNILLTDTLEPKIGDWGLAKFLSGTTATDIHGFSPSYAAPEQVDPRRFGRPGICTDVYGAGAILYELVTGRPPFTGEGVAEITGRILNTDPVSPSILNPAAAPMDPIIRRCLEKEPGKRYQTAGDLERDLRKFLDSADEGPR